MQSQFEVAFALKIREELCSVIFIGIYFSLISFLLECSNLNCKPLSFV